VALLLCVGVVVVRQLVHLLEILREKHGIFANTAAAFSTGQGGKWTEWWEAASARRDPMSITGCCFGRLQQIAGPDGLSHGVHRACKCQGLRQGDKRNYKLHCVRTLKDYIS
jgi:hypothetical protein